MVVEEALRDVEDPIARHGDRREGELEPGEARLVAPRHLGGHDPVEGDSEALVRGGEQIGVAVRDHAEPKPLVQPLERAGGVQERRPVAHALRERRDGAVGDLDAVVGRDASQARGEDVAIGPVGRSLGVRLVTGVRLEKRVVLHAGERRERPSQRGEQAGLPVDQRAVAVEGEDVEAVVVERHGLGNPTRTAVARRVSRYSIRDRTTEQPLLRNGHEREHRAHLQPEPA